MAYELLEGSRAWPHPPTFNDLTTSIIRNILSFSLDLSTPLGSDEESFEIQCCNCLDGKPFPFCSGETEITLDENTGFDCRVLVAPCHLDQNSNLGPWKTSWIPALALTNNIMYTVWTNLPIWVFCSEHCLEIAIRRLPHKGKDLFSRVRLFERSNHQKFPVLSRECYDPDGFTDLTYVSRGNTLIEYEGINVWVKDLWRIGTERTWELEEEDKEAQRARKGKSKRKRDGRGVTNPTKKQKVDREMAEVEEDWKKELSLLSPRSQLAKKLATNLEVAFMDEMERMDLD